MTRINCGIPPAELTGPHLIAEHREIKRIPNTVKSGKAIIKNIPETFRLGTGHVKFFYNKLLYLQKRYNELYRECINRGYKVQNYEDSWDDVQPEYMNDYTPTPYDMYIIRERIEQRLNESIKINL